jgi:hypothetical protein
MDTRSRYRYRPLPEIAANLLALLGLMVVAASICGVRP